MTDRPRSPRVAALTGIRGVAALLVVATHAAFWTGRYTPDLLGGFFARLEIGVALFFVLSGYLLFRPWIAAAIDEAPVAAAIDEAPTRAAGHRRAAPSTTTYLWHRARRILPAYWFVVTITYLVYLVRAPGPTGRGWDGYLRNLTLTQIYGFGHFHVGLTQTWSLAVEASFYLVLPVFGWIALRVICRTGWHPFRLAAFLVALALATPLWLLFTHDHPELDVTARLWPPAFLVWFAGGMLLAVAATRLRQANPYLLLVFVVVAFFMACTPLAGEATIVPQDPGTAITKAALYLVVAVGLLAPLAIGEDGGPVGWLCSRRPVVWLGEISYELFLVHVLVLELIVNLLNYPPFGGSTTVAFAVTLAVSVPSAWALHRTLGRWIPTGGVLRARRAPVSLPADVRAGG